MSVCERRIVQTDAAPPPAGTYSQAVAARGEMIFVAGQTPRRPDGSRLGSAPFAEQAELAMSNLAAIAAASDCTLAENGVHVTVYLRDLADRAVFDAVYARHVGSVPPARAIVQSNFTDFDLEVSAVLVR